MPLQRHVKPFFYIQPYPVSYALWGSQGNTDTCYDRGIPFFGEIGIPCFGKNGFWMTGLLNPNRGEKRPFFCMILVAYLGAVGLFFRDHSSFGFFSKENQFLVRRGLKRPNWGVVLEKKKWRTSIVARVWKLKSHTGGIGTLLCDCVCRTTRGLVHIAKTDGNSLPPHECRSQYLRSRGWIY